MSNPTGQDLRPILWWLFGFSLCLLAGQKRMNCHEKAGPFRDDAEIAGFSENLAAPFAVFGRLSESVPDCVATCRPRGAR